MSDLIDREAAIDAIYHHFTGKSREECAMILHEVTSQPERKKGKWKVDWDWGIATCTNCNHDYDDGDNGYLNEMRYCPFCGAKMEGEE